jgi:hypothetical protein
VEGSGTAVLTDMSSIKMFDRVKSPHRVEVGATALRMPGGYRNPCADVAASSEQKVSDRVKRIG